MTTAREYGTTGSIDWIVTNDKELIFTGSGETAHYTPDRLPPWTKYKDIIHNMIVNGNIYTLGNCLVCGCSSLVDVEFIDNDSFMVSNSAVLTKDGATLNFLFPGYSSTSYTIQTFIGTIDSYAFAMMENLQTVVL